MKPFVAADQIVYKLEANAATTLDEFDEVKDLERRRN